MNSISIIDNNFDTNITTSYFLSIQLSLDGFSFCVLDPMSNEYIQFGYRPIKSDETLIQILEEEYKKNEILSYSYQKVFVCYNTSTYTLVPDGLFSEDDASAFLDFTFTKGSIQTEVFYDKVKMTDFWCVFSIPKYIITFLNNLYDDVKYLGEVIPFIESALLNTSIDINNNVHINVNSSYFDIVVTSGSNLILHNTFAYNDVKDFLYFVLFVFEQLKLDTSGTKVYLSGSVTKNDEIYIILKKYIKNIVISDSTKHFKFAPVFKNTILQPYLNLFNIPICV